MFLAVWGVAAGLLTVWLWGNRNRVEVLSVERPVPDTLVVTVDSCNGAPSADVRDLGDGRFEIETRTTQGYDAGQDCGDIVEIPVDPARDSFEVIDRVSGTTYLWPED